MECQTMELGIMLVIFGIFPALGFAILATRGEKKKEKTIEELYAQTKKKSQQITALGEELAAVKLELAICKGEFPSG